jgi:hypothetical protein
MRSIDLHWLSKRDKWLILPELRIEHAGDVHRNYCYYYPPGVWTMPSGLEFDTQNGLIFINADYPAKIESTMAHEWRHHYQHHSGMKSIHTYNPELLDWSYENYKDSAKKYFSMLHERDALLFQCKMVEDEGYSTVLDMVLN